MAVVCLDPLCEFAERRSTIDATILAEAKKQALAQHLSLGKYIEAAVREKLSDDVRETPAGCLG